MNLKNYFTDSKYTDYAVLLKTQGLSGASIKRKLSSIASFEKFLLKKGLIDKPVTIQPTIPKPTPKIKTNNKFLNKYTLLATLFIIFSALGWGLYNQTILKARKN
ncbi:MAG: hypothetical protein EOM19_05925, partial [Candidatus Moranbacteria bacterium]|nr:hypothetical protein [Candidatus Moranbacteria bacterium]